VGDRGDAPAPLVDASSALPPPSSPSTEERPASRPPVRLELADFTVALRRVQPSALREVAVEVPDVKWEDIGGQAEAKARLREAVEWPLLHPEAFTRLGIRPPKGVLLYGPPGASEPRGAGGRTRRRAVVVVTTATRSDVCSSATLGPFLSPASLRLPLPRRLQQDDDGQGDGDGGPHELHRRQG
jgi:hypothetical protein